MSNLLWNFNPNRERSAFFDVAWQQCSQFADHRETIADASKIRTFCDTVRTAALKLIFTAERAERSGNILSPEETASILETAYKMSDFHHKYHLLENIPDPVMLEEEINDLALQMEQGMALGWEFKLSGKFPQIEPKAVPQKNHAKKGAKPR